MVAKPAPSDPARWKFGTRRPAVPCPRAENRGSVTVTDTSKDDKRRHEVADTSDRLMERLTTLKAIEAEKAQDPMSTPHFHELAEEVTQISRDIFSLALNEERTGDDLSQSQATPINEESDALNEDRND